jgi:hypothetical protein
LGYNSLLATGVYSKTLPQITRIFTDWFKKSVRIREIRGGRVFNEPNANDLQGILHKN